VALSGANVAAKIGPIGLHAHSETGFSEEELAVAVLH
jgi:hypothetical protein